MKISLSYCREKNGTHIKTIPKWIFNTVETVKELHISNTPKLQNIETISNLKDSLEILTICSDVEFSLKPINKLENLKELTIYHENCKGIDFSKLQNLKTLNIYNLRVNELPQSLFDCICLKSLIITNSRIKTVDDKFLNLINLEYLGLSCGLKEIPEVILRMCWLKELDLSNNFITDLPSGLNNLFELKSLNLNDNKIKNVNVDNLKDLKNLTNLNLGNNKTKIPTELKDFLLGKKW